MMKQELLSLPKGEYLLSDGIYNFKYIMKIDPNELAFSVINTLGNNNENIVIINDNKRLSTVYSLGSINFHKDHAETLRMLRDLHIICKYNKETFKEDLTRCKIHRLVNLNKQRKEIMRR